MLDSLQQEAVLIVPHAEEFGEGPCGARLGELADDVHLMLKEGDGVLAKNAFSISNDESVLGKACKHGGQMVPVMFRGGAGN